MISRPLNWLFILTVTALAISGFGQMPIFNRYYISSIPGLGWTADFYFTHIMHYVAGAVFLFLITYWAAQYLKSWKNQFILTVAGGLKAGLWAAIAVTGVLRVIKNLPSMHFSPTSTMLLDWMHLALVMGLGATALAGALTKRSAYLKRRKAWP